MNKIKLYKELRKFLHDNVLNDSDYLDESSNSIVTKNLIKVLPKSEIVENHFLVSFSWEILQGHLENLYNVKFNDKPLHLYARLLLDARFNIETIDESKRPAIQTIITNDDKIFVQNSYPEYSKKTLHSKSSI